MTSQSGFSVFIFVLVAVSVLVCDGAQFQNGLDRVERSRVVNTNAGSFRGNYVIDGNYQEFLGIPYALVDDSNPFGEARAQPRINGIYEAINGSRACPFFNTESNTADGSLDCLRLNVYVPSIASANSNFPVMIYIPGELNSGSLSSYGPKYLIRHDVILVTVNYRYGPYGFMCLDIPQVPGNRGLRDQSLAIRWVNDNIQAFGGDPHQLTLFGQGAGGTFVDLHLHSNEERIFNRAIIQSGSSLSANLLSEPDRDAPIKLASLLGLQTNNTQEALSFLANSDSNDVVRVSRESGINFRPCVEHPFVGIDSFITHSWVNASVPKAFGMPILVGVTEFERLEEHVDRNANHYEAFANMFLNYMNQTFSFDNDRLSRMTRYARQFYLGDDIPSSAVALPIVNFDTDFLYGAPVQRNIAKYVESGASNVFYYIFSYHGGRNVASINGLSIQGASHGDDVRYLFDVEGLPAQLSPQDQLVFDRMTTLWTNFAKHSNPTPQLSSLVPLTWTPLTRDTYHYLRIDSELAMERRPFHRRMAFWELFYRANYNYQRSFAPDYTVDIDIGSGGSSAQSASLISIFLCVAVAVFLRLD